MMVQMARQEAEAAAEEAVHELIGPPPPDVVAEAAAEGADQWAAEVNRICRCVLVVLISADVPRLPFTCSIWLGKRTVLPLNQQQQQRRRLRCCQCSERTLRKYEVEI